MVSLLGRRLLEFGGFGDVVELGDPPGAVFLDEDEAEFVAEDSIFAYREAVVGFLDVAEFAGYVDYGYVGTEEAELEDGAPGGCALEEGLADFGVALDELFAAEASGAEDVGEAYVFGDVVGRVGVDEDGDGLDVFGRAGGGGGLRAGLGCEEKG
jgi:hypothetical protein